MTGFDSYLETSEASRDGHALLSVANHKCKLTFSIRTSCLIAAYAPDKAVVLAGQSGFK